MKTRITVIFVLTFLMFLAGTAVLSAQSLTKVIPRGGFLSDVKAHAIGDIVTIIVSENTQALNQNSTQSNSQNSLSADADFGTSFLKSLTGSISSDTQNQYQGTGQVTSRGTFSAQLTARIIEVREDGNFLIRGSREVETNGEKTITVVEGIIRPADISTSNTIDSSKISDARIFHDSKGVSPSSSKPGILTRIINWVF